MSTEQQNLKFPATVVKVLDEYKVAFNRGAAHGIKVGQRFLVYILDEDEIEDPVSGEPLGQLEIVCGIGEVSHIQDKLSQLASIKRDSSTQRTIKRSNPVMLWGGTESETISEQGEVVPFEDIRVGAFVKPI